MREAVDTNIGVLAPVANLCLTVVHKVYEDDETAVTLETVREEVAPQLRRIVSWLDRMAAEWQAGTHDFDVFIDSWWSSTIASEYPEFTKAIQNRYRGDDELHVVLRRLREQVTTILSFFERKDHWYPGTDEFDEANFQAMKERVSEYFEEDNPDRVHLAFALTFVGEVEDELTFHSVDSDFDIPFTADHLTINVLERSTLNVN
jgi:hypothetical protein